MNDHPEDDVPLAEVIRHPSSHPLVHGQNERESEFDALPVRTKQRTYDECKHNRTWINASARTLTCRGCGVDVDPIATLSALARDREFYVDQARWLRRTLARLRDELAELERLERNAKSRIRSARKRRDDRHALIAAAEVAGGIGGYRPWEMLSGPQREVVLQRVRTIVETYAGALEHGPAEERSA